MKGDDIPRQNHNIGIAIYWWQKSSAKFQIPNANR